MVGRSTGEGKLVEMKASAVRKWSWVHKWSSLICTLFLLMICITGLPLIFHHELDDLFYEEVKASPIGADAGPANLDVVEGNAQAKVPGEFIQFLLWSKDEPETLVASVAKTPDADFTKNRNLRMDATTGKFLDEPDEKSRVTYFLFKLHTDMFLGLPGKLFLGAMGLMFIVAIVSGVVVYGPAMRKLKFGTVRRERSRLAKWLDVHNLLGAVTILWVLVVGSTGVLNTWADLLIKAWQYGQLAEMVGQHNDRPRPAKLASVDAAVATARAKLPHMTPSFVAYPGSLFSSKSHYAIFMRGNEPVTSRLLKPVLIDAFDGSFADSRDMPWYVLTLLLSQPLHFGDYGGMPFKIVWAVLDLFTIVVLITGLYLWIRRRPRRAISLGGSFKPADTGLARS